jgi:hypothetical protein
MRIVSSPRRLVNSSVFGPSTSSRRYRRSALLVTRASRRRRAAPVGACFGAKPIPARPPADRKLDAFERQAPRSLSPPGRSATYESFGDIWIASPRSVAQSAFSAAPAAIGAVTDLCPTRGPAVGFRSFRRATPRDRLGDPAMARISISALARRNGADCCMGPGRRDRFSIQTPGGSLSSGAAVQLRGGRRDRVWPNAVPNQNEARNGDGDTGTDRQTHRYDNGAWNSYSEDEAPCRTYDR